MLFSYLLTSAAMLASYFQSPSQENSDYQALARRTDRPSRKSKLPYGTLIESCTVPGTVALTFDDGPYHYTSHVLDLLDKHGAHATFFMNGDNYGRGNLDDPSLPWPAVLHRMINSGHQIGSHTWSHTDLSYCSQAKRHKEMSSLADTMDRVLGFHPVYLRPPYGSCSPECQSDLGAMGYHVVNFDVDTKDYLYNTNDTIWKSMEKFSNAVKPGGAATHSYLVLSHDVHKTTAYNLTEYMLRTLVRRGYRTVTVGECLDDPRENWYEAAGQGIVDRDHGHHGHHDGNEHHGKDIDDEDHDDD